MPARAAAAVTTTSSSAIAANRLLWLAALFDVLAFPIGFGWDRRWHATHPIEDFFLPPHLSVCSMHFLATLTLAGLCAPAVTGAANGYLRAHTP